MNLSPKFLLLFFSFFIIYNNANAFFRTDNFFRSYPRERFYDEQVIFHPKDGSKFKLSANQRTIVVNLITRAVKKINSFAYFNQTNSTTPLQSMRAIGNQFGLSTQAVGGLALFSLVAYGTFASLAPELNNEISRNLEAQDKEGLTNLIKNCMVGISENLMKWVERSIDELPALPRLNPHECIKRSICEAHKSPRRYGLVGLGLQLFFPPTNGKKSGLEKYQLAAEFGKNNTNNNSSNSTCGNQYDDCLINFLDIIQSVNNLLF